MVKLGRVSRSGFYRFQNDEPGPDREMELRDLAGIPRFRGPACRPALHWPQIWSPSSPSKPDRARKKTPAGPVPINRLVERRIPVPPVLHPYPMVRFDPTHPRLEPYACVAHVRICAGAEMIVPTATARFPIRGRLGQQWGQTPIPN